MLRFVALLSLLPLLLAPVLGCDSSAPSASPKKVAKAGSAGAGPDTRPHITSAVLSPSEPVPGQTLVMRYEASGKDGAALTAGFLWHLNDRRLSNAGPELIVPAEARKGDTIKVRMVIQSGSESSEELWREVTVGNTAEEWVSLELVPAGEVAAGTLLTAESNVKDHDGDTIEFEYVWRLNGKRQDATGPTFSTKELQRDDKVNVTAIATDGDWGESERVSNTVTILNSDPKITSAPPKFSNDGKLRYEVEAKDPDGDRRFIYSLDAAPKAMEINNMTGLLTWTPVEADVGKHQIEIRVADRYGGFALQHFELTLGLEPEGAPPAAAE